MRAPSQAEETMMTRVAFELPHTSDYEKFGEIIGFIAGDGTVYTKDRIAFSNTEIFCIKKMLDNFEDVFGVERDKFNYYLTLPPNSNERYIKKVWNDRLTLQKKILAYKEKKVKKRYGRMLLTIYDVSINEEIRKSLEIIKNNKETNRSLLLGFLRGFFAAEGAIIPGKTTREIPNSIQFPQKGKEIPEIIKGILESFGVDGRVVIKQKKADYYCVNITGYENFKKLHELNIADLHPEKGKKLKKGLQAYTKIVSRKLKLPIKLLKALNKKPMTRPQIYDFMNSYPQKINSMIYTKKSYMVKNKLISKKCHKNGKILWYITDAGKDFLKRQE